MRRAMCTRSIVMPREIDEFLAPIPYIVPVNSSRRSWLKPKDPDRRTAFAVKSDAHALRCYEFVETQRSLSHNPVYAQVREQIQNQIATRPSTPANLPSPAALAQKLSVDKGEIQRAYYELEQLGLIKKHTGKDFLGKKPRIDYRVGRSQPD